MTTKTRQLINAENLQAGDEILTGYYDATNESGDDVRQPIYETVAGIVLKQTGVDVITADHPGSPIDYSYGETVKALR
ncbi:hypothetical protein [Acinetobacter phage ABPH49]|nr:hypothetical protein [Acinetobacter phage ABPH49]